MVTFMVCWSKSINYGSCLNLGDGHPVYSPVGVMTPLSTLTNGEPLAVTVQ